MRVGISTVTSEIAGFKSVAWPLLPFTSRTILFQNLECSNANNIGPDIIAETTIVVIILSGCQMVY